MNTVLFSSKSENWETPQDLFDRLNEIFHFTLDVCASSENAKCKQYFNKEQDGLAQDWGLNTIWCNPPYGRQISEWIKRCAYYSRCSVMLLPARTDTKWFHDWIYVNDDADIYFLKGRLRFGNAKNSAPFPSMLVVFNGFMCHNYMEYGLNL